MKRAYSFLTIQLLNNSQKEALRTLWNKEYPKTIHHYSFEKFEDYLKTLTNVSHTLVVKNDIIVGWYADFNRDRERWFLLILDASIQGKGIGSEIIKKVKTKFPVLNGWVVASNSYLKEDGTIYQSPLEFYKKLGFTTFENVILEGSIKAIKIQFTR